MLTWSSPATAYFDLLFKSLQHRIEPRPKIGKIRRLGMLREIAKDILQSDSPSAHLEKQFARKNLRLRCGAHLNEILHAVGKGLQALDERLHLLGRGLTQGRRGQRTSPDGELARDSCQLAEMQRRA